MKIALVILALSCLSSLAADCGCGPECDCVPSEGYPTCTCPIDPDGNPCVMAVTDFTPRHLTLIQGLGLTNYLGVRVNPAPSWWLAVGADGAIRSWNTWGPAAEVQPTDTVIVGEPWLGASVYNATGYKVFRVIDADMGTNGLVTTNWTKTASTDLNGNLTVWHLADIGTNGFVDADLKPWEVRFFWSMPGAYLTNGTNLVFSPPLTNPYATNGLVATNFFPSVDASNACATCITGNPPVTQTNGILPASTNGSLIDPVTKTNLTGPHANSIHVLIQSAILPKLSIVGSAVIVSAPEETHFTIEGSPDLVTWTNIGPLDITENSTNSFPINRTGRGFYRLRYSPP